MGGFTMWNRRTFIKAVTVGSLGFSALPSLALRQKDPSRLLILHTNDIHCRFEPFSDNDPKNGGRGGLNRIAAYIKKMRETEPGLLLFDSGDFSQGTPYFNFFKSEVVLKLMSEMGYNAGTIGNHEFDNGIEGMAEGFPYASYPIVSSNYDFSETMLAGMVKKNLIIERKGVRIGVYGLGIELNGLVDPTKSGKTTWLDPVETALEQEYFLKKKEKCDLVVCLSHLGLEYAHDKISDVTLAPKTHFTDLILGGHTHSFLDKPMELKNADLKRILVNQAGWAALKLGQIEFFVERERIPIFNFSGNKSI
jgi:5'-nucleotidase